MNELQTVGFDYGSLSADVADVARRCAAVVTTSAGRVVAELATMGAALIEAKAHLPHGQWMPWLESVNISSDFAGRVMGLAKFRHAEMYPGSDLAVQA